jgi:pimeloyl-ACP methyl ester carboxylesterase
MRSVVNSGVPNGAATTCIVCLPGAYHTPEDFLAAGFDESVRRRHLPIDLIFVDVEMKHLGDRSAVTQLHEQIVLPLRARGCETLWFLGISLGGFIALDYASKNRQTLNGVCVLAPYLGNRILTREITRVGLRAWDAALPTEVDEERRIWNFLKTQDAHSRFIYLGFGQNDRFAESHRLMATTLSPEAVDVVPGGHDWSTWKILWDHFLDSRFA